MSFIALPISCTWLMTADHNVVQWEHFFQCVADYAEWLRATGVPENEIHNPATFVQPGDLQEFHNVVSWWPTDVPPTMHPPSLYNMLHFLRIPDYSDAAHYTFALNLRVIKRKAEEWLIGQRRDPSNPNEAKAEREARLNRERVARHRLRHTDAHSDDPVLNELIVAAKHAEESASAGRKWIKGEIRQAKSDMDAAILACKAERVARVQRAEEALAIAERQAHDAQDAVRQYKR